jgi:TIR domain
MPLTYSCFISFRHGQDLLREMVEQLEEALRYELETLTSKPVYVDNQVRVGDFYNQALATALCQSACMVMIYVPTYFDASKTYCTREYKAMRVLEQERLQLLGLSAPQQGLIFPIVFRGLESLPPEIKDHRAYYDFTSFALGSRRISKNLKFNTQVTEIARAIADRCQQLETLPDSSFAACDQFALPDEIDVVDWIKTVKRPQSAFPNL